uniref:Uncharacterized protein n=1 Tax=Gorilla gorilla gorilla TaxID=9595 RepID=A0A2I2YYU3_GORGO
VELSLLKKTFIKFYTLILPFSILNIQCESHMIICFALRALYNTYNLSFKMFFREMNASQKVIDCIIHSFKIMTMS